MSRPRSAPAVTKRSNVGPSMRSKTRATSPEKISGPISPALALSRIHKGPIEADLIRKPPFISYISSELANPTPERRCSDAARCVAAAIPLQNGLFLSV